MDQLRAELQALPLDAPDAATLARRQQCEATLAQAKTQWEAAQAALQNHPTPQAFNATQAQLRHALAKNQLKDAAALLADFEHVTPPPSAEQLAALQSDLAIFAQRGGEPFRAGLPAGER